jgi:hypothetical protein
LIEPCEIRPSKKCFKMTVLNSSTFWGPRLRFVF